jgi:hypothetical protein
MWAQLENISKQGELPDSRLGRTLFISAPASSLAKQALLARSGDPSVPICSIPFTIKSYSFRDHVSEKRTRRVRGDTKRMNITRSTRQRALKLFALGAYAALAAIAACSSDPSAPTTPHLPSAGASNAGASSAGAPAAGAAAAGAPAAGAPAAGAGGDPNAGAPATAGAGGDPNAVAGAPSAAPKRRTPNHDVPSTLRAGSGRPLGAHRTSIAASGSR